eukprot:gb/GECG01001667.1/.p1 GENE.gb/GECG01001667.1/~~gb/GECG01001667.1/.p1  ORF type:complete len:118 (+),score=1.40 gb/GECG01001667.1/:1-354(+)
MIPTGTGIEKGFLLDLRLKVEMLCRLTEPVFLGVMASSLIFLLCRKPWNPDVRLVSTLKSTVTGGSYGAFPARVRCINGPVFAQMCEGEYRGTDRIIRGKFLHEDVPFKPRCAVQPA